ncbi:hypothetical protein RRG08_037262 [Elysia crispata]|uniref:Uncharacterized protein n=1 Tax=Elysia crispata TaxID=231223 RepID=A0AAE0XXQ9_9GAST|nr:hypothetical protein RRG08_037262 [Elysia crispata]
METNGISRWGPEGAKLPASTTNHTGARRKVSRPDEKVEESRHSTSRRSGGGGAAGGARGRDPVRANHHHHSSSNNSNSSSQQHPQEAPSHGVREDSPKRVDFSKTHQLREVNWDGTYQDSLAYPSDVINSTLTSSRDIRETNLNFLNFSAVPGALPHQSSTTSFPPSSYTSSSSAAAAALASRVSSNRGSSSRGNANNNAKQSESSSSPPYPPPPSVSNSSVNYHGLVLPPATPSSSASSVMSQPPYPHSNEYRQHVTNNAYHQPGPSSSSSSISTTDYHHQRHPDVRWIGQNTASAAHASSSSTSSGVNAARHGSSGKSVTASSSTSSTSVPSGVTGKSAKLSHVDVKVVQDSKSSSKAALGSRGQLQPSLSSASQDLVHVRRQVEDRWTLSKNNDRPASTETHTASSKRVGGLDLRLSAGGEGGRDAVSAASALLGGATAADAGELYNPRRARPIKKAITADLKEDGEF